MTDTEIVNEVLRLLRKENAGHFDRMNLLDTLDKMNLIVDGKDNEVQVLKDEIKEIKDTVKDVIDKLEWI